MFLFAPATWLAALTAATAPTPATAAPQLTAQQQADVSHPPIRLSAQQRCSVVELRQYVLHPGQRDVLIDLFEREFIEGQEAVGMRVFGQFHDLDNPDRFVWVRGFADMESRLHALNAFYYGPVWQTHRAAANATLIDNDNVLLLHPGSAQAGFAAIADPTLPAPPSPARLLIATIYYGKHPLAQDFTRWFETELAPLMTQTGARPIAWFENETAENTFPRLPVRENENAFVWFAAFDDAAAYARHRQQLEHSNTSQTTIFTQLNNFLKTPAQTLRLEPTARSRLQ
ncbi:MAG: NIPSNAP family protein [Tahibacter sp.]